MRKGYLPLHFFSDSPLDTKIKSSLVCDILNMACVPRHGKTPRERQALQRSSPSNDEEMPMDTAENEEEEEAPLTWREMDAVERLKTVTRRLKRMDARAGRFMRIHPCEASALMYG